MKEERERGEEQQRRNVESFWHRFIETLATPRNVIQV